MTMRLTELQADMLKTLERMPKLTREFVRLVQRDYTADQVHAHLDALYGAGLVHRDAQDMNSITDDGVAYLNRPQVVAGPRQYTNASTGGTWTGQKWTPARPGADDHLRHKSLVGRPTGVIA